jgi:hypothetical protein
VDRDVLRQRAAGTDRGDALTFDQNRSVPMNSASIEDTVGCDSVLMRTAHVVRVIFCR